MAASDQGDGPISVARSPITLDGLPEIPILQIAKYLGPEDLLNFSHTNRSISHIIDNNGALWRKALQDSDFEAHPEIGETAQTLVDSSSSSVGNVDKLSFLMHKSMKKNWEEMNFRLVAKLPKTLGVHCLQNSKRIVSVSLNSDETFLIHTWDVRSGSSISYHWNTEVGVRLSRDRSFKLLSVYNFDSILVLIFVSSNPKTGDENDDELRLKKVVICGLKLELGEVNDVWEVTKDLSNRPWGSYFHSAKDQLFFVKPSNNKIEIEGFDVRSGNQTLTYTLEHSPQQRCRGIVSVVVAKSANINWLLIACCNKSNQQKDRKGADYIPPGLWRIAALNTVDGRHHFLDMPTGASDWESDFKLVGRDGQALLLLSRQSKACIWNIETGEILQEFSTLYNDEPESLGEIVLFNPLKGRIGIWMFRRNTELQVWKKNCHGVYEREKVIAIPRGEGEIFNEDCILGQFVRFEEKLVFTSLNGDRADKVRKIDFKKMSSVFYSPFVIATTHASMIMVYDFFNVNQFRIGTYDVFEIPEEIDSKNFCRCF